MKKKLELKWILMLPILLGVSVLIAQEPVVKKNISARLTNQSSNTGTKTIPEKKPAYDYTKDHDYRYAKKLLGQRESASPAKRTEIDKTLLSLKLTLSQKTEIDEIAMKQGTVIGAKTIAASPNRGNEEKPEKVKKEKITKTPKAKDEQHIEHKKIKREIRGRMPPIPSQIRKD